MWPGVLMCLMICFAAVGAAWLYEFEVSESFSVASEPRGLAALKIVAFLRNYGLLNPQDLPARQARYDHESWRAHLPLRNAAVSTQDGIATLKIDALPQDGDANCAAGIANDYGDDGLPLSARELRQKTNLELIQHALALEAELRASERKYRDEQLGSLRMIFETLQHNKETEFRQNFLPRVTLTAGELLLRLGKVEIPPHIASVSIKLGIAMLVSGDLAGPNPMSPVADVLVFLMRRLPR